MAGPTPPDPADVLSVSAINRLAKQALEEGFPSVWVSGEVSQISRAASGHVYVTLKDESASISSTIFRSVLLRIRFDLKEGMQVLARGRLTIFESRGTFQLNIEQVLPKGIGPLELAFQQMKERLEAKGYFDRGRKKPLPRYPKSIALVTSPNGAAIRDMLEILTRRWPVAAVLVVPVRVQGDGSAAEIATAIRTLNRHRVAGQLKVEAMIIGRGGGSLEDLWAFNEEIVADAIFASLIPVISAVGHEIDVTISDLVADHRALTPSHAIADLTPDHGELLCSLQELGCRLRERISRRIELARQRLDGLADRRAFRNPLDRVREMERRLDEHDARLHRALTVSLQKAQTALAATAGKLESLSPLNVLARGYSLTQAADGQLVRDAGTLRIGDVLNTRLAAGEVKSRVESILQPESA